MRKPIARTSVSLDPNVLKGAQEKVVETGQSVSSYINLLIRRDLGLNSPRRKIKQAA